MNKQNMWWSSTNKNIQLALTYSQQAIRKEDEGANYQEHIKDLSVSRGRLTCRVQETNSASQAVLVLRI